MANWRTTALLLCLSTHAFGQCLSSGDESTINNALTAGGAGAIVQLCPSSTFSISGTIAFTADDQELSTQGYPTDSSRALIQIANNGNSVSTLVQGAGFNGVALKNVIVDGNRPAIGKVLGGGANIELGGSSTGQIVSGVASMNPRAWSCMHFVESGAGGTCTNATISNNDIGPCGNQGTDASGNANWADGISMGCTNSLVSSNSITGSTDGGIVCFGCPGSTITGNTITSSSTDRGWGAINMVDYITYDGSYANVQVTSNTITGALLFNLGISIGSDVWSMNDPITLSGPAVVSGNTITGNVAFPIALNGWTDGITVQDNNINVGNPATYTDASPCSPAVQAVLGSALIYYPAGVSGAQSLQSGFTAAASNITDFLCANAGSGDVASTSYAAGQLTATPGQLASLAGYIFFFQNDANFVVEDGIGGAAEWSSGTSTGTDTCDGCEVAFQADGNLVIYNDNEAVFSSNTNPGGATLEFIGAAPWVQIVDGGGNVLWTTDDGNAL